MSATRNVVIVSSVKQRAVRTKRSFRPLTWVTVPETLETLTAPDVRRYSRTSTGNDYATRFQNLAHHG